NLADPDPSIVSDGTSKKRETPHKRKEKSGKAKKSRLQTDVGGSGQSLLGGSANPLGMSAAGVGATGVGRSATCVGRSGVGVGATCVGRSAIGMGATGVGRSATGVGRSGVGRSGSGVGVNANPLGRFATLTDEKGVNESANQHDDGIDVGGSANVFVGSASGVGGSVQGTGGSGIGRGIVRGCDIPGFKWSPPQERAFNRVGGCSFSTRPRHQNVRRGFARWFGNDDSGGVSYDMNADTQGNQVNQTSSQAIPFDQGSQTEVENFPYS
ncbi:hypothetical protein Tco_1051583, partial [Tanacetum coccineum]